jgi:hypothetical protein
MANDVFDIANDVEVSIFTLASSEMVWSVSRWDQDFWTLGTETPSWQVITGNIISVETNNGFTVTAGYTRPETPSAVIAYSSADYDPFMNSLIRPGTPIRIRIRPNPDTAPTTWVTLWQGKVLNCEVSYSTQFLNTVYLTCDTNMGDVLNYVANGINVTSPCYAYDFINVINTESGSDIRASTAPALIGYEIDPFVVSIPVNYGNLLNTLTDTNVGGLVYKPLLDAEALWYYTWPELVNRPTEPDVIFESESSATANRADFSDIVVGFDTSSYVNTLRYFTAGGVDDVIQNEASVEIVGNLEAEVTTRHFYAADADAAATIVTDPIPTQAVNQVTSPMIQRSGQLNEFLLRDPFDTAGIFISNDKVEINESYYISAISHSITIDSWDATFTLWRGR